MGDHEELTAFRPIAEDATVIRYSNGGIPWNEEQIRVGWRTAAEAAVKRTQSEP